MGGSINIAIKRYAGVILLDDTINIDPDLPRKWKNMSFKLKYKDIWYNLDINRNQITIKLFSSQKKSKEYKEKIIIRNKEYLFKLNQKHTIRLKRKGEIDG